MPTPVANISLTNTFDYWLQRSNEAFDFITNKALSVNTAAATGAAYVNGSIRANTLYMDTISSGNSTVVANLAVVSNNFTVNTTTLLINSPTTNFNANVTFVANLTSNNTLNLNGIGYVKGFSNSSFSANATSTCVLDEFDITTAKVLKYIIRAQRSANNIIRASEILVVTNAANNATFTEYAIISMAANSAINSSPNFISFKADVVGSNVRLTATGSTTANATLSVSGVRILIT